MRKLLLVRFGEIHLKGLNRPYFLNKLTNDVRQAAKAFGGKTWIGDSRIFVYTEGDLEACTARITKVFGVHSVSPAIEMEKFTQDPLELQYACRISSGINFPK